MDLAQPDTTWGFFIDFDLESWGKSKIARMSFATLDLREESV
jgi:hypothetical protein